MKDVERLEMVIKMLTNAPETVPCLDPKVCRGEGTEAGRWVLKGSGWEWGQG